MLRRVGNTNATPTSWPGPAKSGGYKDEVRDLSLAWMNNVQEGNLKTAKTPAQRSICLREPGMQSRSLR
jgi:hypothetical protein